MSLPIARPFSPMEADTAREVPAGPVWQYEPKWDGFRCIVFRDGEDIELQSKLGDNLTRYFPEIVSELLAQKPKKFVIDGEIIIPAGSKPSFDDLLTRVQATGDDVKKLAQEHPAMLMVFDLLVDEHGRAIYDKTLCERRSRLEQFAKDCIKSSLIQLSPATPDFKEAQEWFKRMESGIVAKRRDLSYQSGNRSGMQKIQSPNVAEHCVTADVS
jgi:ATP-dependent DNA ligase